MKVSRLYTNDIFAQSMLIICFSSEWFDTNCGVKQGDTFSPTIFGIFINDIVDVESVNIGINIDGINVCILLYADDIVLLSETEEGLQKLLDKVYEWSKKWKIKFKLKNFIAQKSNILHIRQPHVPRTDYSFKFRDINLSKVEQYKYLGIVINEFNDYNFWLMQQIEHWVQL